MCRTSPLIICGMLFLSACTSNPGKGSAAYAEEAASTSTTDKKNNTFNSDSAYAYMKRQVEFGPRVPNTEAHRLTGEWLEAELQRHGARTISQKADIKAFDGTVLKSRNIMGRFNENNPERILLLAHWDSRPWADQDPDPSKRKLPVDGANDGASGTGLLLEIARLLGRSDSGKGVDILFVDAEDWGNDGDEDSWALGTRYFIENPPVENYLPQYAILLDMVGGTDAVFCREYFSERSAPGLAAEIWSTAADLGYGDIFLNRMGSAVTDDHVQLIANGIPAIDIIEYHPGQEGGFNPRWHTTSDNMEGISKQTLEAVGNVISTHLGL